MSPRLPPPDPHESLGMEPSGGHVVPTEAVVFVHGPPTSRDDALSSALLALRPGMLIVVAGG